MNNDINKSSILAPLLRGRGWGRGFELISPSFPVRYMASRWSIWTTRDTQKPRQVVDAITDEYYSVNANVHRGVHFLSQQATELHEARVRRCDVSSMPVVRMRLSLPVVRRRVSTCLSPALVRNLCRRGMR